MTPCASCTATIKELWPRMYDGNQDIALSIKTVATSCPACMMQITDMLSRRNQGIKVKHVVELYAESL